MTKIRGYTGFSWEDSPSGKIVVSFREADGSTNSSSFDTKKEALDWVRNAAPKRLEWKARLRDPVVYLEPELDAYPARLARNSDKERSNKGYRGKVVKVLRRMFQGCSWKKLSDLTIESLDAFFLAEGMSATARHRFTSHLRTFLRWQATERAHTVPAAMAFYQVRKPKSVQKRRPWKDSDYDQYEKYLLKDIAVLADCDPRMSWHERIRECCLEVSFAQRMLLVPFYLLSARYLMRMTEICEAKTNEWNYNDRIFLPLSFKTDRPRTILTDIETGWMLDCQCVGRSGGMPLILSSRNKECVAQYLHELTAAHLVKAGLEGLTPYGVKYGTMSKMFRDPESFTNLNIKKKLELVREISGHTEYSECAELYIDSFWGSEHHAGVRDYYDTHRILPFKVEDFPTVISPGFSRKSG